jgi:hypothetical protein
VIRAVPVRGNRVHEQLDNISWPSVLCSESPGTTLLGRIGVELPSWSESSSAITSSAVRGGELK